MIKINALPLVMSQEFRDVVTKEFGVQWMDINYPSLDITPELLLQVKTWDAALRKYQQNQPVFCGFVGDLQNVLFTWALEYHGLWGMKGSFERLMDKVKDRPEVQERIETLGEWGSKFYFEYYYNLISYQKSGSIRHESFVFDYLTTVNPPTDIREYAKRSTFADYQRVLLEASENAGVGVTRIDHYFIDGPYKQYQKEMSERFGLVSVS